MKLLDLYWMTDPAWYGFADDEVGTPFLTEEAPAEAKESFKRFLEQKKSMNEGVQAIQYETVWKRR